MKKCPFMRSRSAAGVSFPCVDAINELAEFKAFAARSRATTEANLLSALLFLSTVEVPNICLTRLSSFKIYLHCLTRPALYDDENR